MTLWTRRPRPAGFTLIELLVVMGIITVLMSLLMAGVQRVRDAGKRTENFDRIAQIGSGIAEAKTKNNMPYVWAGNFTLKGRYAGTEPELDLLLQMFPNMYTALNSAAGVTNGYMGPDVVLDANQALLLLLTGGAPTNYSGFSNNAKQPFTPPTGSPGEQRKGPYLQLTTKWYTAGANGHGVLIDPFGMPYAVLASVGGKTNNYGAQTIYGVSPYTNGGKVVNENGYQIISAGKDKTYGPGGALPAVGSPGGEDDQANFSKSVLGSGIN